MATITVNNEAVRLVQQAAEREGKSINDVIIEAFTERASRFDQPIQPRFSDERRKYWIEVGRRNRESMSPEQREMNVDDLLYDDLGLPK